MAPIALLAIILAALALGLRPSAASAAGPLSWSVPALIDHQAPFSGNVVTGLSCPSTSLCVGVDDVGNVLTATNPTGGLGAWTLTSVHPSNSGNGLSAVSCPSTTLCVAVDVNGDVLTSTDPTGAETWTVTRVDKSEYPTIEAIACPSTTLCIAVDESGNILSSTNPTGTAEPG
jgi:hypothetical protein